MMNAQITADRVTNSVTSHTWNHKCFMCTFRQQSWNSPKHRYNRTSV